MKSSDLFIEDPTTGNKSVSLTLLVVSAIALITVGGLEVAGLVHNEGPFKELLYSTISLYFARRVNINGKSFSLDKDSNIISKIEEDNK